MNLPPLPIDSVLPDLIAALRSSTSTVLRAPTGAGKTTRAPVAILDSGITQSGRILMLEPRRLAARAAARRMCNERGCALGDEIGYQVRFDRKWGARTRIVVVTPGILLRMLHDDPYLEFFSFVIFDEFHERGLESDLALGMVRLIQQTVRPELRIVVMSATLAAESVSAYLGACPIVNSEGRLFPVDIVYQPRPPEQRWQQAVANAVRRLLDRSEGDILVFLAGLSEIRQTARELEPLANERDLAVLPLYGDLPLEQQDAALLPQSRRKIILATNVAETSVTVEGVTGVVDTGLAKQLSFDPAVGLDRLEATPISRASADQRTGRAGRMSPGVCIRLWSEVSHRSRLEQTDPEIRRVDLAGAVLQLLALGEADPAKFLWLDPPHLSAVAGALALLKMLGAWDGNGLTNLGQEMAKLPVHPRLARLLLEGQSLGCSRRAALAAALLSERDPFQRSDKKTLTAILSDSDVLDRIEALEEFERTGRSEFPIGSLHRGGASFVLHSRDQLVRLLNGENAANAEQSSHDALLKALLQAYPDRLARRRNPASPRGVMMGGRGVKLMPSSHVVEPELFLCIDVDAGTAESLVRVASGVRREWLPEDRIVDSTTIEFNRDSEKIEARRVVRFEDLILNSSPVLLPNNEETARALATAALEQFDRIRPSAESPAGQYLLRLRCLREWLPELGLPAFDDSEIREITTWLCAGCRSFEDLRKADWLGSIKGRLSHSQLQAVEREAPEKIEVPSGSQIALSYEAGRPPVLAVRIQEMFGLADTPRVGGGRIKVLLHLLAPNYRPQQVTDDLSSFWANTYPTVRKELRARYPKHSWPENPLEAEALRGAKRRPK